MKLDYRHMTNIELIDLIRKSQVELNRRMIFTQCFNIVLIPGDGQQTILLDYYNEDQKRKWKEKQEKRKTYLMENK